MKKLLLILLCLPLLFSCGENNEETTESVLSTELTYKNGDSIQWANVVGLMGDVYYHDIVTSHDGRRSFATNCYLNGIPASQIMEITGHKTESSFLRYIQETRTPQAPEIFKVFEGIKLKKDI